MSETIDRARSLITARLAELEAEAATLEQALRSMGETTAAPSPRRRHKSRRRRKRSKAATTPGTTNGAGPQRSRKRAKRTTGGKRAKPAPRGQRGDQFLAVVKAKPGAKISEIAAEIGAGPNQLYPLAKRLQKQRKIRKSGAGFRLTAQPKAA